MQRREKGMGSIYQRANGSWVGTIRITDRDGKKTSKSFSGRTEAEVKRKIRDFNKQEQPADTTQILFRQPLKTAFCGFDREILLQQKDWKVQNTVCIVDFSIRIVGAKDPVKTQKGSF